MPVIPMQHDTDPKKDIWEKVGDLSEIQICYSQVLVGIYMRPDKTKSGLHLPDAYRDEDGYQGKACLVLKCGPLAFQDTESVQFNGFSVAPGDWVVIRPSDGLGIDVRKQKCRLVSDAAIRMVIKEPSEIF